MQLEKGSQWFGHPGGLSTLFFTEMWERFSYYGMRALLVLFMTAPVATGGLGWEASKAGPLYGLYTAMVYVMALPGGWVADRLIGAKKSVLIGGVVIMSGHISLMFHGLVAFYAGLFLIIIGTGLLKPNISALVGTLYDKEDSRRDSGFSIFYMGINIGAFFSPLICGFLAQHETFKAVLIRAGFDPINSWHWGFGAAAVGMGLGVIQYLLGGTKAGRAFQWIALALLVGFFVYMAVNVLGGGSNEAVQVAEVTSSLVSNGMLLAAAVVVLHVLWLVCFMFAPQGVVKMAQFAAIASSLSLLVMTFVGYRQQTGWVSSEAAEMDPRNGFLVVCMLVAIAIVLFYTFKLFADGNKTFGISGLVVAAGLALGKIERISDASAMDLFVRMFGYILPLIAFVYFARVFLDKQWTEVEHKRLAAIPVFFIAAAVFWSFFEQAGSSLTLFAQRLTDKVIFGLFIPASWFQSVNALFIVALAPVFAWAWPRLAGQKREPTSTMKFAVGLYLLGVGFATIAFAAIVSGPNGGQVGPSWLLSVYLMHTLGELCLSPVGLSTMTKLAPERLASQMMGVWFLGAAIGNFIAGMVAGVFETLPLPTLFGVIFATTLVATLVMLAIVKPMKALMSGIN